jgi:hypothetical protein
MSPGLVYYVLDATRSVQYLKIGFTTDLRKRVADLAGIAGSGQPPLVLALEEGGRLVERKRHDEFVSLRSHGEWFRYEEPLRAFVATLEHPFAYLLDRPHLWQWAGAWGPLGQQSPSQKPFDHDPPLMPTEDELDDDQSRIPVDF